MNRPPITRSGARLDAHRELSKAIYHPHDDPLVVRVLRAIGRHLDQSVTSHGHVPVGVVVLVLLLVAVAVVAARRGPLRRSAATGAVLPVTVDRSAADHRAAARTADQRGDWHTAVVERMRAVARELEERGVLDARPGRTAVEVATEAAHVTPELQLPLTAAARAFDAVAYGGRPADAAAAQRIRDADEAVRRTRYAVRAEGDRVLR